MRGAIMLFHSADKLHRANGTINSVFLVTLLADPTTVFSGMAHHAGTVLRV